MFIPAWVLVFGGIMLIAIANSMDADCKRLLKEKDEEHDNAMRRYRYERDMDDSSRG